MGDADRDDRDAGVFVGLDDLFPAFDVFKVGVGRADLDLVQPDGLDLLRDLRVVLKVAEAVRLNPKVKCSTHV